MNSETKAQVYRSGVLVGMIGVILTMLALFALVIVLSPDGHPLLLKMDLRYDVTTTSRIKAACVLGVYVLLAMVLFHHPDSLAIDPDKQKESARE